MLTKIQKGFVFCVEQKINRYSVNIPTHLLTVILHRNEKAENNKFNLPTTADSPFYFTWCANLLTASAHNPILNLTFKELKI